eukprot:CAMPEP_0202354676 /NCGR_PEP_ID=MMETSP1126-20121109/9895_1 /ASSEMBLY_ACC=CAM_ASM_000457 /TAXON_ID=3047 /ORGANISM="Dunaliella tertiolecta, Strain CCMP1320" /LENGTH=227 /DNA_ID=CAMNT_0048947179 /DNA_START=416 /DNA_END=1100 /DNA_ORIENTATION=-
MSMSTWMEVPALAGSIPNLVKMNGRPVPSTTLVMTIKNRDKEIAPAFSTLPLVAYTRANPPADKLVPSRSPTADCSARERRALGQLESMAPVASPRITLMALWFPALPPAPTSIVRNSVTTPQELLKEASTNEEVDCTIKSPSSHLPLAIASSAAENCGGLTSSKSHISTSGKPLSHSSRLESGIDASICSARCGLAAEAVRLISEPSLFVTTAKERDFGWPKAPHI